MNGESRTQALRRERETQVARYEAAQTDRQTHTKTKHVWSACSLLLLIRDEKPQNFAACLSSTETQAEQIFTKFDFE